MDQSSQSNPDALNKEAQSNCANSSPNQNKKTPRGKRRNKSGRPTSKAPSNQPRPDHRVLVKHNENMAKFYKLQPILENPNEFEFFMEGLRETLPASFRINTFERSHALFLRRFIQGEQLDHFLSVDTPQSVLENSTPSAQDEKVTPETPVSVKPTQSWLNPLSWYPKRFAYQMNNLTRLDLKRTPILRQLHKFIMAETDNGFISRQEAVSMIPPLVLDVHRGHNVLDMCAAPGSKTAQLLEYLNYDIMGSDDGQENLSANSVSDPFDDGMVVANDIDNKRCYMLVHQSGRLNSPNCIIINEDATRLPILKTFFKDGDELYDLKFDRVLCDVPCSGDGTVRKNPDVWKKWTVGNTNNFHGMQVKILKRGLELLKKDGLLVYSTCSMSPMEDEAVIAAVLRSSQGTVELQDSAHKLVGLNYRPGISSWMVLSRDMEVIPSVDKVPQEHVTQLYPSLFPPTDDEIKNFNLHKCIRILPHFQNTGGFFVAVLKKLVSNLPWQEVKTIQDLSKVTSEEKTNNNGQAEKKPNPNPKRRRFGGYKEDPFFFIHADDPDWMNIRNVYGFSDNFPFNQLVHRCKVGKKRSIHLVSKRTRNFIIANQEEPGRLDFVKLINGGMRLFNRADTEAGFRICQDGVSEVLPYIRDSFKVPINKDDLTALLKARAVPFDSLSSSKHVKDKIKPGSFILIYHHNSEEADHNEKGLMPIVAWKGEKTVALYVSRTYRVHLCALANLKMTDDGSIVKQDSVDACNRQS